MGLMRDDKKKPLTPRQEILPPEKKGPSPLKPHNPDGVIDAAVSGFVARAKARSIDANNRMREAQLRNIKLSTDIAYALKHQIIAWDELADIDAILEGERRERAYQALVARVKRDHEISRLEHETMELEMKTKELEQKRWELGRDHERRKQHATSLEQQKQWQGRESENKARAAAVIAETKRQTLERIQELNVQAAKHAASREEAKAHEEAIDAQFRVLKATQAYEKAVGGGRSEEEAASRAIDIVLDQIRTAEERRFPKDVIDQLYQTLGRLKEALENEQEK